MKKHHPRRHLKRISARARRTTALMLCAAMVLSLVTYVIPAYAAEAKNSAPVNPVSFKDLYIREADENTMDAYIQASLGGQVYTQFVDGVSAATVRNNYGTRYAGEVWADKSVFALGQPVIPKIRPFEVGHKYSDSELRQAIGTLETWLGSIDNINFEACGFQKGTDAAAFKTVLTNGSLTAAQANALNDKVNASIADKVNTDIAEAAKNGISVSEYLQGLEKSKKTNLDGYFDGENLYLRKATDGVDYVVSIDDLSDFLEVFSVLGSSEVVDSLTGSVLDVVFIMDASGSLNDDSESLFLTGVKGETYTTDFYSYVNANGNTVKVPNSHTNVNSRLEFAAEALNSAFETLMQANSFNRVALLTYNSSTVINGEGAHINGINEVLSLGRYAPNLVKRDNNQSGGYYAGATRYFTIAQDGGTKRTDGGGDSRFSGVKSYNSGESPDGNNEWNLIEINARATGSGNLMGNVKAHYTNDSGELDAPNTAEADKNYFIGTGSMTETQMGITKAMQQILGKADPTVRLKRNGDKLVMADDSYTGADVFEVTRRPVVILLTDGRINPTASYTKWWDSENESINSDWRNGDLEDYGNMPLYIAATASLWKKIVNMNYYGDPKGADGLSTLFYTFGLALTDTIEMDSGLWTGFTDDLKDNNGTRKTLDEYFRGVSTDANDSGKLGKLTVALEKLEDALKLVNGHADQIEAIKKLIADIKAYYTSGELSKIETLTLADRKAINTLVNMILIRNGDHLGNSGGGNLVRMINFLASGLGEDDKGISDAMMAVKDVAELLEAKVAYDAAQAYVNYLKGEENNSDWEYLKNTILNERPTGTISLKNGTLDLDDGTFKAADGTVLYNGKTSDYRPQSVSDLDFADKYYNVTNPQELPTVLVDLVAKLAEGSVFKVVEGANSAGFSNSLTYSDPVGKYMTVDNVTYVTLFGNVYKVKKAGTYEAGSSGLPQYISDYLKSIGSSANKTANTTFTVYEIDAEVKDGTETDIDESNSARTNESTGETFDLLNDIHIWVEDTGEWRDSDGSDFIVDNAYSQALYININAKALPTQIATITLNNGTAVNYTTNLNVPKASTPLRVFYNVSMDPGYLRYLTAEAEKDRVKDQAVGVALSKVSPEYLEKNTAYYTNNTADKFYDKTESGAGRYTAFYSNFFTDSTYDDYAVMTDTNKNSRGNATVTFSPGEENQFYRFQKNRVLFLIPGSFGLEERPAEIDFGDLAGIPYYVNVNHGIITTEKDIEITVGGSKVEFEVLNPANYEHLLALLNATRANLNWNGEGAINSEGRYDSKTGKFVFSGTESATTYWRFGDCMPVDGSLMTHGMIHEYYDTRKIEYQYTDATDKQDELHTQLEENLKKAGNSEVDSSGKTVYSMPTIAAENWYYIIREFYCPVFETGDNNSTSNVEVRYMAIARKGNELGTGVGGGQQEFVCWYDVNSGEVKETFDSRKTTDDDVSDAYGKYGKPNDDKGIWYVAAAKGGLRVGGLANFAGVKGYGIREGVGDGNLTKNDGTIAGANVTETAKTYFLPTISTLSGAGSSGAVSSLAVSSIVVNAYLGNNGRILVHDSTLAVTKTVNTTASNAKSEEFEFEIEIKGHYGERGAVVITRDEFNSSLWRRRFDTIDVLTDNRNLLLGDDNNLAMMDVSGQRVVAVEQVDKIGSTVKDDKGDTVYSYYLARKGDNGEVIKYAKADAEGLKLFQTGGKAYLVKVDTYENFTYIFRNEADREKADADALAAAGQPLTSNYEYIDDGETKWDTDAVNGIIIPDIWPDEENGGSNARDDVYYAYVGENLRTGLYNDKTLRVFKADVEVNDGVVNLTSGDIYGNQSMRGGRTYYVTAKQYNELDQKVKENANVTWTGDARPAELDGDVKKDTAVTKPFLFYIIPEDGENGYQAGDREFWINKVYLIPIGAVNGSWQKAFENNENYSSGGSDWRQEFVPNAADTAITGALGQDYKMLPKFNVAHIRSSDREGATTDTELASNNGFYTTSSFLTTKVKFDVCTDPTHGHYEVNSDGSLKLDANGNPIPSSTSGSEYGVATIKLRDGQGLGFNNIINGAGYVVTECVTEEQSNKGIHFEQVEHVQKDGLRTKYQCSTGDNTVVTAPDQDGYDKRGVSKNEADWSWYWDRGNLGKNVAVQESYKDGFYFWQDGERVSETLIKVTADFSQGVPPADKDGKLRYTAAGQTSSGEQAVHYVNFLPDIVKMEFTPGENETVYTNDFITYGIRWENFAYDAGAGESEQAAVIIRDLLDPGLTFVSAVFNPCHSNMMDDEDTVFSGEGFLEEYKKVLELKAKDENTLSDEQKDLIAKWENDNLTLSAGGVNPRTATYYANDNDAKAAGVTTTPVPKVETLNHADDEPPRMTVKVEYEPDTTGGATGGTVIWTITDAPADAYGYVVLTVQVNTNAIKDWDYTTDASTGAWGPKDADNRVRNRASVQVGNITRETETVTNPTGEVEKVETKPGNGFQVATGDKVDYYIGWTNSTNQANTVTIEDRLDPGVYFCRAWVEGKDADGRDVTVELPSSGASGYPGYPYDGNSDLLDITGGKIAMDDKQVEVSISYDPQSHMITWELKGVPAYYSGKVYFSVYVNERANYEWTNMDAVTPETKEDDDGYSWPAEKGEDEKYPAPEWSEEEGDKDYRIYNRARVKVSGENWQYTDIVENPTKPEKKEITPGDSDGDGKNDKVAIGDLITYTITWQNTAEDGAKVTVTDKLDPGLTFVEAGIITVENGRADSKSVLKAGEGSNILGNCTVTEAESGDIVTITWIFDELSAGDSGMVYLTVEVNERAFENWQYGNTGEIDRAEGEDEVVVNMAVVKVGDNPGQNTEVVENPVEPPGEEPKISGLTIKKTLKNADNSALTPEQLAQEFTFTLTLILPEGTDALPESLRELNGSWNAGTRTYTYGFKLKHNGELTISGLPVGTVYTVAENRASLPAGCQYTSGEVSNRQLGEDAASVEIVNTYTKPQERPETSSLTIRKTLKNADESALTPEQLAQEFTFTLTLILPEGTAALPESLSKLTGYTWNAGTRTYTYGFKLKHSGELTISGLPVGTAYTVAENRADLPDGCQYTGGEVSNRLLGKDAANVEIVNTYTKPQEEPETVSLTIRKTVKNADESALTPEQLAQEFTFTLTLKAPEALPEELTTSGDGRLTAMEDGTYRVTLCHGQTLTISGLPAGTEYQITEDSADGYVSTGENASGTISEGSAQAAFTNTADTPDPDKGNLTVSKTVAGNAGDQSKEFHFTVTLSDSEINGTYGDMTFVNGVASFTLRHGSSRTAVGLPADITYSVTEAEADQDDYVTTASGSTGTIPGSGTAAASFTNTREEVIELGRGGLIVSKTVGGNTGDKTKEFHFAVILSDSTVNGTYGGMTFVNGVATFTLRHGESRTATGLPAGITYSVMEREANQDGYTTASKGRDGTIPEQGTAQASFFNTRGEPQPGDPPLEDFDDPEIPLGGFPDFPDVPETGDRSRQALWLALAVLSAIGLLLIGFSFKVKRSLFRRKR